VEMPDIQSREEEKTSKNVRAVLIIKREQQFGIFIYCNVILESFFISFGWFLNENVDGKGKNRNAFNAICGRGLLLHA
jgi:hypothetical protein